MGNRYVPAVPEGVFPFEGDAVKTEIPAFLEGGLAILENTVVNSKIPGLKQGSLAGKYSGGYGAATAALGALADI